MIGFGWREEDTGGWYCVRISQQVTAWRSVAGAVGAGGTPGAKCNRWRKRFESEPRIHGAITHEVTTMVEPSAMLGDVIHRFSGDVTQVFISTDCGWIAVEGSIGTSQVSMIIGVILIWFMPERWNRMIEIRIVVGMNLISVELLFVGTWIIGGGLGIHSMKVFKPLSVTATN